MMTNDELKNLLDTLYVNETRKMIGIDIDKLSLKNYNVKVNHCKNCTQHWRFVDCSLTERNIALYVHSLEENGVHNYCIGKDFFSDKSNDSTPKYMICFETNAVDILENAIRKADMIKAIYSGRYSTKMIVNKIQKHKELKKDIVEKIIFY